MTTTLVSSPPLSQRYATFVALLLTDLIYVRNIFPTRMPIFWGGNDGGVPGRQEFKSDVTC